MRGTSRRTFMAAAVGLTSGAIGGEAGAAAEDRPRPTQVRRVVTGHNVQGRSIFIRDTAAPHVYQRTAEGVTVTEVWETRSTPADNSVDSEDPTDRPMRLQPPKGGSIFRTIRFMPEKLQHTALKKQLSEGDDGSGIVTALKKGASSRAPGFHTTNTIDYVIVLSGEIYALMDEGEVLLKSGDVLVQRGTSHAWSNRSRKPADLAFVLIDANPVS